MDCDALSADELSADELSAEENEWLTVRRFLERSRFELGIEAADGYPELPRLSGTPLLTPS
ncbi:MAG TPA: hypothetical protein VHF26_12075, partial [Trebonia sp.]|nr:hypothetical protein [Trebonia sp.]